MTFLVEQAAKGVFHGPGHGGEDVGLDRGHLDDVGTNELPGDLEAVGIHVVQDQEAVGQIAYSLTDIDPFHAFFIEMEIADTGQGIPQEVIGKIFDPLVTTKAKGIGLGLAVCRTIIERHEGNIEVKSEVGKGTTFTIRLPLKAE